jgi:hypothetical protein
MKLCTALAALGVAATLLAACGNRDDDKASYADGPTRTEQAAVSETPTADGEPRSTPDGKPRPKRKPARTSDTFMACDANITVRTTTTTCELAQSTFYEYWYAWNYLELSQFSAYSPATDAWLEMTCRGERRVRCTADDGSDVRFPMSAVTDYTEDNARTYATQNIVSAEPGDTPDYASSTEADTYGDLDETETYGGEDYDDPVPYDRDCADFAETDFPTPPGDPDGLDADGDGIACES